MKSHSFDATRHNCHYDIVNLVNESSFCTLKVTPPFLHMILAKFDLKFI